MRLVAGDAPDLTAAFWIDAALRADHPRSARPCLLWLRPEDGPYADLRVFTHLPAAASLARVLAGEAPADVPAAALFLLAPTEAPPEVPSLTLADLLAALSSVRS